MLGGGKKGYSFDEKTKQKKTKVVHDARIIDIRACREQISMLGSCHLAGQTLLPVVTLEIFMCRAAAVLAVVSKTIFQHVRNGNWLPRE